MNQGCRETVVQLVDVLEEENRLLGVVDYAAIGKLVEPKRRLLSQLARHRAQPDQDDDDSDRVLACRLDEVAHLNREALRRAMLVQSQIVHILSDAARRMLELPGYDSVGARPSARQRGAYALIVQA